MLFISWTGYGRGRTKRLEEARARCYERVSSTVYTLYNHVSKVANVYMMQTWLSFICLEFS